MGGDGFFDVSGKIFVDGCRGIFRQKGDALLDRPPQRRWSSQQDIQRGTVLNDDFGSGADAGEEAVEVAGGFGFRDVDGCHGCDHTAGCSEMLLNLLGICGRVMGC